MLCLCMQPQQKSPNDGRDLIYNMRYNWFEFCMLLLYISDTTGRLNKVSDKATAKGNSTGPPAKVSGLI